MPIGMTRRRGGEPRWSRRAPSRRTRFERALALQHLAGSRIPLRRETPGTLHRLRRSLDERDYPNHKLVVRRVQPHHERGGRRLEAVQRAQPKRGVLGLRGAFAPTVPTPPPG
jgi:hypothetical protein